MGRAPCCDKANVKKGPWSPEEDAKLKVYIEEYGTGGNWIALPQKIGLNRCGKSCRLRWLNYLRPNIRHGGFTEEEDNTICSLYISIGSRWSIIAAQLPGRTDNDIKNYWNTRLKKKLLGRRKQPSMNGGPETKRDSNEEDDRACDLQNLSSSAMERLQLHMQLQNPFSLHNNSPPLWPKLSPLQEKMIQTLKSLNENQPTIISPPSDPPPASADHSLKGDEFVEIPMTSGFTRAELDDMLNDKSSSSSFLPEEMVDASKSSNDQAWWPNEFDAGSVLLNSWDLTAAATATALLHDQSAGSFQDYVIEYDMH